MKPTAATFIGIALALFGPPLIALCWQRATPGPATAGASAPWLLGFAVLVAGVAAIAAFAEGLGFADIGFGRISWQSITWAIALTLFLILAYGPAVAWLLAKSGLGGFEAGQSRLAALPSWYLALTIVIVAAGEEWLYRGYAVERLAALTSNIYVAGGLSLIAFGLAHLPLWGIGVSLTTLLSGAISTGLYIWRRDVSFLMLAHVATDLYGLVIAPAGKG
jgi:membrane protease YdiL (CAAX protease family)